MYIDATNPANASLLKAGYGRRNSARIWRLLSHAACHNQVRLSFGDVKGMNKMIKIIALCLLGFSHQFLFGTASALAQEGLLDDRAYAGQFSENHMDGVKEDKLVFLAGRFQSHYYAKRGFGNGAYTAWVEMDKVYFKAEIENPKNSRIYWQGFARGDNIVVTFRWHKKGWLSNTEKDYSFHGKLEK
jgi:hypothetical protein